MLIISHHCFINVAEDLALAGLAVLDHCQVIGAKHHVLCRNGNRFSVGRLEQVVCRKHQEAGFRLCLCGEREVDSHLVTVEVRIERGTDQRVQLDGSALDEYRLKCLNAQTVQGRRTVQQNRMVADHMFECIPDIVIRTVNLLAGALDILDLAHIDKAL